MSGKRRGLFGTVPMGAAPTYDTPLNPQQEAQFQQWAQKNNRANDTQDYDLRGAWLSDAQQASNGHLPDTYKKPNHPTFSDESRYSTPQNLGGHWGEDGKGGWVFWARPANLRYQTPQGLLSYFRQQEPDSLLILPFDYRLPRGR